MPERSEPHLPILIVGDVHGDLERLFQALKPYPASEWRTIFLGDLVDNGPFGVGNLRYARDRAHSVVLLGNHEVAMLWALRDPTRIGFWIGIGGQEHDLSELAKDVALQQWMRERPALLQLRDSTLVQHCGTDSYALLLEKDATDPVATINARAHQLLLDGGEAQLWDLLSGKNIFPAQPERLVVFGHTPHRGSSPEVHHGGKAINFDGGFSRFHSKFQRRSPLGASVAPLPD